MNLPNPNTHLEGINSKIVSLRDLMFAVNHHKILSRKVVFTNGCFDILHAGHIDYLVRAADLGHRLVVGVNSDASIKRLKGENRPINNENDRAFLLAAIGVVSQVVIFDEDTPLELIKTVKPDFLVKGGDYTLETIVGAKEVMAYGGKVEVLPFLEGHSTTGTLSKILAL